jgi:type 1 fimbriae regulatory protein FimE
VRRAKSGTPRVHPLGRSELRSLRRLLREQPEIAARLSYGATITDRRRLDFVRCSREQVRSEFPFSAHPHMLRHACGYKLANDGQPKLHAGRLALSVIMPTVVPSDAAHDRVALE